MNKLTERNNEIFRRWQAGENHIDLAHEYNRSISRIQTLIRRRHMAENEKDYVPGPPNKRNPERERRIARMRDAGWSYQKIAEIEGVCRERIRQIWKRHLRKIGDPRGYGMQEHK